MRLHWQRTDFGFTVRRRDETIFCYVIDRKQGVYPYTVLMQSHRDLPEWLAYNHAYSALDAAIAAVCRAAQAEDRTQQESGQQRRVRHARRWPNLIELDA